MIGHKYFRLSDDHEEPGRCFLNGLRDAANNRYDVRCFTSGKVCEQQPFLKLPSYENQLYSQVAQPLAFALRRKGRLLDFTLGDFDVPVVSQRLARTLDSLVGSDLQRIPVNIAGSEEKLEIVNALRVINCIDTRRSEIRWFQPGNDVRPDLAGTPEMITKLFVEPDRAQGYELFRLQGWEIALIVSEHVKDVLQKEQFSGLVFNLVS